MSDALRTVLISLGTSLIVSLITFILGLRSGKNQADRQKMQELYKKLYSHFSELKKSIEEDRCRTWESYDHIEKGNRIIYTPPVRKLEMSGDLIFLKKRIAEKATALEVKVLSFGSDKDYLAKDIHVVLLDNLSLLKEGYAFEEYSHNKGKRNALKTANPTGCNAYRTCSYKDFFSTDKLKKLLDEWDSKKDYALKFSSKGNPPDYSFCLYPDSLNVSVNDFIQALVKDFGEKVKGYRDTEATKKQLLKDIDNLLKKLRKRTVEPFTFWETFFGAFADLFR